MLSCSQVILLRYQYTHIYTSNGQFSKKENNSIQCHKQVDSIHCSVRTPLHSPHQGFWMLILKLLDQSTKAMTGRPAL